MKVNVVKLVQVYVIVVLFYIYNNDDDSLLSTFINSSDSKELVIYIQQIIKKLIADKDCCHRLTTIESFVKSKVIEWNVLIYLIFTFEFHFEIGDTLFQVGNIGCTGCWTGSRIWELRKENNKVDV